MIVLALRTDKPEAELYLVDVKGGTSHTVLAEKKWLAHRELAETIHSQIKKLLDQSSNSMQDLGGIICYQGPGSFTGLRIGLSVANALATGLKIPVVATQGQDWLAEGAAKIAAGADDKIALPYYDRPANITLPKK